jgi:drug/metabolite transporter (DMT)-like permease
MFASITDYVFLGETFTPLQLFGAAVTLGAVFMINYKVEDAKQA